MITYKIQSETFIHPTAGSITRKYIYTYEDLIQINKEAWDYNRELDARQVLLGEAMKYMNDQLGDASFKNFTQDTGVYAWNYSNTASDILQAWILGTNDAWGNFSVSNFMSKAYATTARQTQLINILTL